jgi:hypothetical protein
MLTAVHSWARGSLMSFVSEASAPPIVLTDCVSKMRESSGSDPFVEKYVFPG